MLLNKRKETLVKFNPGLSANRPSNNLALALRIVACQKGIQDSRGFSWIPDSRYWIPDSGFLELFSGFQSPGFQIPQVKIYRIPETRKPLMGD